MGRGAAEMAIEYVLHGSGGPAEMAIKSVC